MATPVETVQEPAGLTLTDRCDACSAAAQARAVRPGGGDLLFCGHHSTKYGPALLAQGWIIR